MKSLNVGYSKFFYGAFSLDFAIKKTNNVCMFESSKALDKSNQGIVTIVNWTMAPDGNKYLFFWSAHWKILTDKDIPIDGFHSSERWQLAAVSETGQVIAIFPGCQVKAWVHCANPHSDDCYSFGINEKGKPSKRNKGGKENGR